MRVHDLARHGLANVQMAGETAILRLGRSVGEVLLAIHVAAHAEVRALDGAETEAVLVVVTRRAQTPTQLSRPRVTDEPAPPLRGSGESIGTERHPRDSIGGQRTLKAPGEVLADERLLVLGLMAAAALAVRHRLREVGMALGRVTLPAVDTLGGVTTLGVVGRDRSRVTGRAGFNVGNRPGDRVRTRAVERARHQTTATARNDERDDHEHPRPRRKSTQRFHNRKGSSPSAHPAHMGPWPNTPT